jgi:hypothetical protein
VRAARRVERGQRRLRGHDAGAPAGHSHLAAPCSPGLPRPRDCGAQPRALPGAGLSRGQGARPRRGQPRPARTSAPRARCDSRCNRQLRWRRRRPRPRSSRRQRVGESGARARACRRGWRRQCAGGGAQLGAGRLASRGAGRRAGRGSGGAQAAPARARGAQAQARRRPRA